MASISVILMTVSLEEADMIEAGRAGKAAQARMRAETAKLLATASGYDAWLAEGNRPINYGTFHEYMGSDATTGAYLNVCGIISTAERLAAEAIGGLTTGEPLAR